MLMQVPPETEAVLASLAANSANANTIQQKDTTWTKLFVGGLPYHTTDKSLREHFSVYGDIEEAVVITDRQTNKSRGYGFVIMGDRAAAERACKEPNPIIDGRKANVNLAILGAKPRGNLTPGFPFAAAAAGLRTAGYPVLPGQFSVPPYIYGAPYLTTGGQSGVQPGVPIQATQLASLAAATNQFYEYQNALAASAVSSPYPTAAAAAQQYSGFETYPYSQAAAAGAAAQYMNMAAANPYAQYAATAAAAQLPQGATTGFPGLSPYQGAVGNSLQEARLQ